MTAPHDMNEALSPRVREILEWPAIEREILARCATEPGRACAAALAPLSAAESRARMRRISSLVELIRQGEPPDFSGVTDIGPPLAVAEKEGTLSIEELAAVRDLAAASSRITAYLRERRERFPALAEERDRISDVKKIEETLRAAITETGELSGAAYPVLRTLRDGLYAARRELEERVRDILHSPSLAPALQERIATTRNDRCVLLVKAGMKDRVKGTVHDVSASGATYYIEPIDIIPLNNRVLTLDRELRAETARILRLLTREAARHAGPLLSNCLVLGYLDFLAAAARLSIDTMGSEPEICDGFDIVLRDARHPILHLMAPDRVVASDIQVDAAHPCLVISGANTGGKTVLLKTIGLCALFAMYGLHLPAGPDSRIGVFARVLADIGDDQSIARSLSTFSGQIEIVNEMLAKAGPGTLALIDEIVVGTGPRQGASLAQAILERLAGTGGLIVATTHYTELKDLPALDGRFMNASVSFDAATLTPSYRLITGLPGVSYALEIARRHGLPEEVISRARELLDSRELSVEALIEKVHGHEREIAAERERLARMSRELADEKKRHDDLMAELERRSGEIRRGEGLEFLGELKEYRRLVAERITGLQRMGAREAGRVGQDIAAIEKSIRTALAADRAAMHAGRYVPLGTAVPEPGMTLFVAPLEQEGTVESVDTARRTATLLFGSIRATHGFDDLLLPARPRGSTAASKKKRAPAGERAAIRPGGEVPAVLQTSHNTVDLRGARVEEGLRIMEKELDRMARGGIDIAIVIHGHGTGAMKEAVRSALRHSPYAESYRPGEYGEGGDGVTIVRIRA